MPAHHSSPPPPPFNSFLSFPSAQENIYSFYHQETYPGSDIDLFIYGLDEEAAELKMIEIYETISKTLPQKTMAVRSKNCVTIVCQYPFRHIQVRGFDRLIIWLALLALHIHARAICVNSV